MIKIDIDIKGLIKTLDDVAKKQVPFAMSKALNEVSNRAKEDIKKEMSKDFDRPTSFTLNSLYVKYSNKRNLMAEVGVKPIAAKYLVHQVEGGRRLYKKVEGAVKGAASVPIPWLLPGGKTQLNASGNVSKATYGKVLSSIQGQATNTQKGRKRKAAVYWLGKRTGDAKPFGIMQRKGKTVSLAFAFGKTPKYKKRLPFAETAGKTMRAVFAQVFRAELAKAIGTAK